jgi:predicted MFS family arabinose efflux permease
VLEDLMRSKKTLRGVPLLGLGAFATGMDAYVMAGLLTGIGRDLGVSVSQAGQCVTVFTLCYAVSAPLFSAGLARMSTRSVLLVALLVFTAANTCSALAGSFPVLLASRAVAGMGAGLFSPTAAIAAAALVPPDRRGRALALVLGGMSGGTVLGVPLGLLLAADHGWRAALWLVTAAGALAFLGVATRLPAVQAEAAPTLRERLAGLSQPGIVLVIAVTFTQTVASLGLYTYLQPVLHGVARVDDPTAYLWVWGLGGVCGSLLSGTVADRTGRPALLSGVLLAVLGAALAVLPWAGGAPGLALLPLFVWGAVGWAFVVPQQHRLISAAGPSGAAVALNSSATYLGGSVGSALGGGALAAGISARWLPLLAASAAVAGVFLHMTTLRLSARPAHDPTGPDHPAGSSKGNLVENRSEPSELRP